MTTLRKRRGHRITSSGHDRDSDYFSDKESGPRAREEQEIDEKAWGGILALIESRMRDGSFGAKFPEACEDGCGPCGCDEGLFYRALEAEFAEIETPLYPTGLPSTLEILDMIEFCHRAVGKPHQEDYHSFYRHFHLTFDIEEGQSEFRNAINRILARNKLAYRLEDDGSIIRLAPPVLGEVLVSTRFRTKDQTLNQLLDQAVEKFSSPDEAVRRDSLEKLWDAWERLKTIESGKDKKAKVISLLRKAVGKDEIYEVLDTEARNLTLIGNNFRIRHSETDRIELESSEQVDYLFHRLFALIHLLLKMTGRLG
jgi:hypothetical protein